MNKPTTPFLCRPGCPMKFATREALHEHERREHRAAGRHDWPCALPIPHDGPCVPARAAGIDAETLAEALRQHWPVYDPSMPRGYRGGPFDEDATGYARTIAAEYDRLAAEEEAEHE